METRFTVVTAVDERYLEYLRVTLPTWLRHEQVRKARLVLMFDAQQLTEDDIRSAVCRDLDQWACAGGYNLISWRGGGREYAGQRDRMLSSFIDWAPMTVDTLHWMKLDADVAYLGAKAPDFPLDDWLNREQQLHYIASPWGYTKPADYVDRMDEWGDAVEILRSFPRLNIHPQPGSGTVRHPRMCSWLAFFGTIFTRSLAFAVRETPLPVISQDGLAWYASERISRGTGQERGLRVQMKRYGWAHRLNMGSLRKAVAEAWGGV